MLEEGLGEHRPPRVAVSGPPDLVAAVTADPAEPTAVPEAFWQLPDARARALQGNELDVIVEGTADGEALAVQIHHISSRPRSARALRVVRDSLDDLEAARFDALESQHDLQPEALDPPEIHMLDTAPVGRSQAALLSLVVPLMLMITLWVSGVYPAVVIVVGERESGALETSLLAAVPRLALVVGKVLALLTLITASVLGNAIAAVLTLLGVLPQLNEKVAAPTFSAVDLALAAPTLGATVALVAGVLVLAALPCRTFKQGQNAVNLAALIGMTPAGVAMMPAVDLDLITATVPVMSCALVLREAMAGQLAPAPALVAALTTAAAAAAVLALGARVVRADAFLFGAEGWWRQALARLRGRG